MPTTSADSKHISLTYRLLAPGPVPVPPPVLQAMSERVVHHRTPQFVEILQQCWRRLQPVFGTRQPVQILTGTGSAAMEAAVCNTISPGDRVLVVVSGKFGERWAEICKTFGAETERWNVAWGEALDLEEFAVRLKQAPSLRAVFTQVCETSTATLHPVQAMAKLVRQLQPDALFAVDAITAVGCLPLPMDEWDIDVMVAGSQKAFMLPTGLSFIALSERAWRAQTASTSRKFYLDLGAERKANAKGDSQFSIPTPLVIGLNRVLLEIEKRGLECLWRRCAVLSECSRWLGERLQLSIYAKTPSPSVTAWQTANGQDTAILRDRLERDFNIVVMGGQDQLKGRILRVGHMGDVRDEDMLALAQALAEILQIDCRPWLAELRQRLSMAPPLFT